MRLCCLPQNEECLKGAGLCEWRQISNGGLHEKILEDFFFLFSTLVLQSCTITGEIESGLTLCAYRTIYKYFHGS